MTGDPSPDWKWRNWTGITPGPDQPAPPVDQPIMSRLFESLAVEPEPWQPAIMSRLVEQAIQSAADQRLIEDLARVLEERGRGGVLVIWSEQDLDWRIIPSDWIPDDRIYLSRPNGPDLGVQRQQDGTYQGYRGRTPREDTGTGT